MIFISCNNTRIYYLSFGPHITYFLVVVAKNQKNFEQMIVREASHQPAFMSNRLTISHMFYNPIYPVDEGNEDVG